MSERRESYTQNRSRRIRSMRRYYRQHIAQSLFRSAKLRAFRQGLAFNIALSDVVVPTRCPVFGIEIKVGKGKTHPASPSLDRLNPRRGYVKGNVCVISWRANELKRNGTVRELEAVLRYMKAKHAKHAN